MTRLFFSEVSHSFCSNSLLEPASPSFLYRHTQVPRGLVLPLSRFEAGSCFERGTQAPWSKSYDYLMYVSGNLEVRLHWHLVFPPAWIVLPVLAITIILLTQWEWTFAEMYLSEVRSINHYDSVVKGRFCPFLTVRPVVIPRHSVHTKCQGQEPFPNSLVEANGSLYSAQ